jgi:cell division protein FtsQ
VGRSGTSKQARRVSAGKKLERERRQRATKARQVAAYVVVAVALFALVAGIGALYRAPILPVKHVEVQGVDRLRESSILLIAKIPVGATLLRFPGDDVEKRLKANAWVANATVVRKLPGTVRLIIVERVPLAIVDAGGTDLWLISADGHWLGRRTALDEDLLVIRDIEDVSPVVGARTSSAELANALKVVRGISEELRSVTRVVSAPTIDKTALITQDDVEVFVGEAVDLSAKDRIIRQILGEKKDEVVYINVRVVESPIWRGLGDSR